MGFAKKPKVDTSAIEAQRKAAEAEKKKLEQERTAAEIEKGKLAQQRRASQKRRAGRSSLITNVGGELGQTEKLG